MKGAARLTLFYIVTFIFFLGASVAFSVIRAWAGAASAASPLPFSALVAGMSALAVAVPLAVYAAVLSSFTYSSRHEIGSALSTLLIFLLTTAALFSFGYGERRLSAYDLSGIEQIDGPALKSRETAIARFENGGAVAFVGAFAVVAAPDAPLRIAEKSEGPEYGLRSVRIDPFAPSLAVPLELTALGAVFSAAGRRLDAAALGGIVPLLAYAASLSLLLASFRFLAGSTRWPLADFVLSAVALRGVAALDEFLASALVHRLFSKILGVFPVTYSVSIALTAMGLAVVVCAGLAAMAGGRRVGNV